MNQTLDHQTIAGFSRTFHADRANLIAAHAVSGGGISAASKKAEAIRLVPHSFSVSLPQGEITNQRHSGRCWIFAACNLFRSRIIKNLNLKDLELSQTYLFFWDKLERAHYYLRNVIRTSGLSVEDRLFQFLTADPVQDGGQWDLLMNLVEKYGIVPIEAYPDNFNAMNSGEFRKYLTSLLRQDALVLRRLCSEHTDKAIVDETIHEMMNEVYRVLCISLGEPPQSFDWLVRDKDEQIVREDGISPKEFFDRYVGLSADSYVSLIHAPTDDKPFFRSYTVEYLGNVVGGRGVHYVNVPMERIRSAAVRQLEAGEPIWFGSDCGKFSLRDEGLFDRASLDVESLLNVRFTMDKGERLSVYDSLPNHAMLLQGVHLSPEGKPMRWRIENSWGEEAGKKGYYAASDAWMGEYAYQFVINKRYLDTDILQADQTEPIVLPAWDPMGTLAD